MIASELSAHSLGNSKSQTQSVAMCEKTTSQRRPKPGSLRPRLQLYPCLHLNHHHHQPPYNHCDHHASTEEKDKPTDFRLVSGGPGIVQLSRAGIRAVRSAVLDTDYSMPYDGYVVNLGGCVRLTDPYFDAKQDSP
jgi:hypothetical protein